MDPMFVPYSCDGGGDCGCLCESIATFADVCSQYSKPVRWRKMELCRKLVFYIVTMALNKKSNPDKYLF